jgi:NADH-quinone oxidoreductase subunit G
MSDVADAPQKTTVTITIDGREVETNPGELVIAAAQRHGVYIPRFCYHERMNPVGMCRMCLVDIDTGRGPALSVSCMVPVAPGMAVVTDSPKVKKAQEGILEFLLVNHPLDCPVCDKGGECPLQDQAFTHGPGESRFVEEKRHYEKPIPISDLVFLDRERCILCDRCTRFAKEVAGDPLIHFTNRGNTTQVLTFPDEPFASYFSGNTVQICPVGALTAKPYRFKARPWDLEQTESTCTTCAVGCRVTMQSSRNQLLRYQGVDSDPVNWGWLCDRGRFDFEAVNSDDRLRAPLVRVGDTLVETSWAAALDDAARRIADALRQGGPSAVGVIGGARGTNEDAYAWARLAKAVIGTDNVDAQLGDGLPASVVYGLPRATIDEAAAATTVVLLGPDLKEELPVLYLRLRDAAERRQVRILELASHDTGLTPYAWKSLRYRPGEQAALVRAILGTGDRNVVGTSEGDVVAARDQLGRGDVVVVAGRPSLAEQAGYTVDALAALRNALPGARFLPVLRRGNVNGALDLGLAPGLLPGRVRLGEAGDDLRSAWGSVPAEPGLDATGILQAAAEGRIACLVLLGADPLADFPDRSLARRALAGAGSVVAVDTFVNESVKHADVVLSAAAYAEKPGTTTNVEGRVSTLTQKVTPVGSARPDWVIAGDLAARLGTDFGFPDAAGVWDEITRVSPAHAPLTADVLARHRDGALVCGPDEPFGLDDEHRDVPLASAYDFRLSVSRKLYDAAVGTSRSPSLAGLAPGARLHLHPLDFERLGVPDGTAVKVTSAVASAAAEAVPDSAVPRGVAWMAFNQPNVAAADLVDVTAPVNDVKVETL